MLGFFLNFSFQKTFIFVYMKKFEGDKGYSGHVHSECKIFWMGPLGRYLNKKNLNHPFIIFFFFWGGGLINSIGY